MPGFDVNPRGSGPFVQAWAGGALQLARSEGIWYSAGKMYMVDTATGMDGTSRPGRGEGAVWELDLVTMKLKAIFVSDNQLVGNNPDNITVSPRGTGLLVCEDNGELVHLCGITPEGTVFDFARNLADTREFAGVCFSPDGETLFVNIQGTLRPSATYAIGGPWRRGAL